MAASTDLSRLSHHLGHLGAQLVAAGAEGAEAGGSDVQLALSGRVQQLVELQHLLLDGVEVAQPLPAFDLPLPLHLGPQTLLLRFSQPQFEDLMKGRREKGNWLDFETAVFQITFREILSIQPIFYRFQFTLDTCDDCTFILFRCSSFSFS